MAFTAEQHKAHRARLKADGICPRCHKNPTGDSMLVCSECRNSTKDLKQIKRKKWIEGGKCRRCGGELGEFTRLVGRVACPDCNDERAEERKRRREAI